MFIKKDGKIYKEVAIETLTKEELIEIVKLDESSITTYHLGTWGGTLEMPSAHTPPCTFCANC